jgi:low temperature requirement protein LtrA
MMIANNRTTTQELLRNFTAATAMIALIMLGAAFWVWVMWVM